MLEDGKEATALSKIHILPVRFTVLSNLEWGRGVCNRLVIPFLYSHATAYVRHYKFILPVLCHEITQYFS